MATFVDKVYSVYKASQNSVSAKAMEAYMRNQFPFFGISSPTRKELLKSVIAKEGLPELNELNKLIALCFQYEEREMQYLGLLLIEQYKKEIDVSHIPMLEKAITTKSWWDTVDFLAPHGLGSIFAREPVAIKEIDKWNTCDNMWKQRSSIIYQLSYKKNTDLDRLFRYCLHHANSKEFFIQKAMGWALRQASYHFPNDIIAFVEKHTLPNLTKRESLKRILKKANP